MLGYDKLQEYMLVQQVKRAKERAERKAKYKALKDLSILHFSEYTTFLRKYYTEEIKRIQEGSK